MSAPHTTTTTGELPALGATVGGDQTIGRAPYAGTVSAVTFTPEANVVADATNYRTLTLTNKGADGNGTTAVATLTFNAGGTRNDFDESSFTLSGTPANLTVAEGDILAIVETVAGTGLANPGGLVRVEISRS